MGAKGTLAARMAQADTRGTSARTAVTAGAASYATADEQGVEQLMGASVSSEATPAWDVLLLF